MHLQEVLKSNSHKGVPTSMIQQMSGLSPEERAEKNRAAKERMKARIAEKKARIAEKKGEPEKKEEAKERLSVINYPYIYGKNTVEPYLSWGKKLLLSAKEYSENHLPNPKTASEIKESFGLVHIGLDDVPVMKSNATFKKSVYLGGDSGNHRTDAWNNDLYIDWDWELDEKDNLYHPTKVMGGRVGFRWLYKTDKVELSTDNEDFMDEEFKNIIRLYFEVEENGKITWKSHARIDFENSDDKKVDDYVEKALKSL